MTVAWTNLTSGQDTDGNSTAVTASVTLTANRLHFLTVVNSCFNGASPANSPTCTGWDQVLSYEFFNSSNLPSIKLTIFRRMPGSDTTGTHTIDFAAQNQGDVLWSIDQTDANVDTTGTNGSGAIVQTAQANGSTANLLATLAAFGSANNGTFGAGSIYVNGMTSWTVGGGFTALCNYAGGFTTDESLLTEYNSGNDTTVDATASTAGNWGMVAVEIKAASGGSAGNIAWIRA